MKEGLVTFMSLNEARDLAISLAAIWSSQIFTTWASTQGPLKSWLFPEQST